MCRACRLLPHGAYTLFPAVLSTMAWIASILQDGCDYVKVTGPIVEEVTGTNLAFIELGLIQYREPIFDETTGDWRPNYSGNCRDYDTDIIPQDAYWTASKAFSFAALVLGGGGALFLWFSSCFVFSPATWRWAGYEVFLASFFQGMAFLFFKTEVCMENTCSLFYGSNSDIAAATLWFVSAIAIFCKYPTPTQKNDDDEEQGGPQQQQTTTDPEVSAVEEQYAAGADAAAGSRVLELPVEGDAKASITQRKSGKHGDVVETRVPDAEIS